MSIPTELRTSIVVDYQNVHLTGHGLFDATRNLPRHQTLLDPLLFANVLVKNRNQAQKTGYATAILSRILVFRGLPVPEHDPDGYRRNLAQEAHWERDARVQVTLRPLKYEYARDASGRHSTDSNGRKIVLGKREKGIDVMCALAVVSEAQDPDIDLVILASSDTDLAPAVDKVLSLGTAKIETFCWYDHTLRRGFQLHPTERSRSVWNTRLDEVAFRSTWDLTDYT